MCAIPLSHKGWLRQLYPDISAKQVLRFERFVDGYLNNPNWLKKDKDKARRLALRDLGLCDAD